MEITTWHYYFHLKFSEINTHHINIINDISLFWNNFNKGDYFENIDVFLFNRLYVSITYERELDWSENKWVIIKAGSKGRKSGPKVGSKFRH